MVNVFLYVLSTFHDNYDNFKIDHWYIKLEHSISNMILPKWWTWSNKSICRYYYMYLKYRQRILAFGVDWCEHCLFASLFLRRENTSWRVTILSLTTWSPEGSSWCERRRLCRSLTANRYRNKSKTAMTSGTVWLRWALAYTQLMGKNVFL